MRNYEPYAVFEDICEALDKVGITEPIKIFIKRWNYRLRLDTGQSLDVFWNGSQEVSSFDFFHRGSRWTDELQNKIRHALQVELDQEHKPHEKHCWPASKWKWLVQEEVDAFVDISVNHSPMQTQIDLVGYLPDDNGEVPNKEPMVAHIELKYNVTGSPEVLKTNGSEELINYAMTLFKKAGLRLKTVNRASA